MQKDSFFILVNATHLVGARRRVCGGPGDLEAVEHGDGLGDLGDVGPEGGGRPPPDDLDVPLLEAVVGAADAQEEERQEDDGADDEQDLELAQRLQRSHLLLDGRLAGRGRRTRINLSKLDASSFAKKEEEEELP